MPHPAFCLWVVFILTACAEPLIGDGDVIRRASDPAYEYGPLGEVRAVSCNVTRPSGYSSVPSGCQRDVVFARQVAHPADLVDPLPPGPAPSGPVGRAAQAYDQAGDANLATAALPRQGGRAALIYPPAPKAVPTDAYYAR